MPDIPPSDTTSPIPRSELSSADKIAKFIRDCYQAGLVARRDHEKSWLKVRSIMSGKHYFEFRNGACVPVPNKPGVIRAVVPLMKPMFRREMGRVNSNQIGVTAIPKSSGAADGFNQAQRTQAIMDDWIKHARIQAFFDNLCQNLLYYGLVGIYRYADPFRQQVFLKSIPAPELLSIPAESTTWEDSDGIMRCTLVTRQWLELQDEKYERQFGRKPDVPLAKSAGSYSTKPRVGYAGYGMHMGSTSQMTGALATWFWMKPSETAPLGQSGLMIDDKLVRFNPGQDPQTGAFALNNGRIPIEPIYYTKLPDDWYGYGFCEDLISMQLEANRQMTSVVKAAVRNVGWTTWNSDLIDIKDIKNSVDGLLPHREPGYDSKTPPILSIPPTPIGREVGAVLQLVQDLADRAAAYESNIIYGRQEGRTDGGPATNMLNVNAQAPLQPVVDRIYDALANTYPYVLDMLRYVWPEQKVVTVAGRENLGSEIIIAKSQIPWSKDVIINPMPVLANGKNAMISLLFQLRGMSADNGEGAEVKSREFRRSLQAMGMTPPGINLADKAEQRILYRIARLIGDGTTPDMGVSAWNNPQCQFENHKLAMQMIIETMLDPSFRVYGNDVKNAIAKEFAFHQMRIAGVRPPDNFDDAIAETDAKQAEDFLEAAENDPESQEGQFAINGALVGA